MPSNCVVAQSAIFDSFEFVGPVGKSGIEGRKHCKKLLFVENAGCADEMQVVSSGGSDIVYIVGIQSFNVIEKDLRKRRIQLRIFRYELAGLDTLA